MDYYKSFQLDQHHKMSRDELFSDREKYFLPFTIDLSSDINHYVNLTGI